MLVAKPVRSGLSDTFTSTVNKRAPGTPGNAGTGSVQTLGTYNIISSRYDSWSQGYKNTEYTYLVAKGKLLPMTPWTGYSHRFRVISGVQDVYMPTINPYYRYWTEGAPYSWQTSSPQPWVIGRSTLEAVLDTKDSTYFVQAAAAKLYSSGWDTLTFTAELTKTIVMFRGFISRITQLALSGKLESLWLEGRYGWRTLWYDMKDIDKAIQNLDEGRKRFRDKVGTTISGSSTRVDSIITSYGTLTLNTAYTDKIGIRGTVVADIEPPRFQFNPITTAWELMRLSFVVDWVINVGQFLEGLSFLALAREYTAAGGLSITRKYSQTSSLALTAGCFGNWNTSSEGEGTLVRRVPSSVSTIPLPKLRLDGFKVLDLIALLIQAISRNKAKG